MRAVLSVARDGGWGGCPIPARRDLALAAVLGLGVIVGSLAASTTQVPPRHLDTWASLLIALAAVTLAWWRAAPLLALVGTVVATGIYLLGGYPYGPIQLCMVLAMFAVARRVPLSRSLRACGLALVVAIGAALPRLVSEANQPLILLGAWAGWLVVPWALGALAHVRVEAAARLRRDLIARVALEERMAIAREVHDIAGHGFSAIAMQAGVALIVLDERPDQVRAALEAIRATSTQSLDELRAVLDTFRTPEAIGPGIAPVDTDRVPRADDRWPTNLRVLLDRVAAAGLPVDLEFAQVGESLPREIAAIVYRIVQESLTNILRHAGPTRAAVSIRREPDALAVEIVDRGRGTVSAGLRSGQGLAGMRARVEARGGTLAAGPREDGGFRVVARLPLSGETR